MLTIISLMLFAQLQQSISQPAVVPVHCTRANGQVGDSGPCKVIMLPNTTAVLVAKESGTGIITDSLGGSWTRDFCVPYDNGECIFHAQFNVAYPTGDVLTFPSGGYADAYVLQYQGAWNFSAGQYGSYAEQTAPLCPAEGDCPYNWTYPLDVDAGNLVIAYSFTQSTGPMLPKPGLGYSVEANDGFLAVEDMVTPVEGIYFGTMIWKMSNGSDSGGSHWLMGIGVYARAH